MFLMDISLEFDTVGAENPISVDACRSPITDRNSNNNNGHRRQILFLYNNFQHTFSHGTAAICIFITRFMYFCRFFEDATLWGLGSSITVIFYLISDAHKSSSVLPQIASSSLAFVISHRYCCLVVVDFRVCCC